MPRINIGLTALKTITLEHPSFATEILKPSNLALRRDYALDRARFNQICRRGLADNIEGGELSRSLEMLSEDIFPYQRACMIQNGRKRPSLLLALKDRNVREYAEAYLSRFYSHPLSTNSGINHMVKTHLNANYQNGQEALQDLLNTIKKLLPQVSEKEISQYKRGMLLPKYEIVKELTQKYKFNKYKLMMGQTSRVYDEKPDGSYSVLRLNLFPSILKMNAKSTVK